MIYDILEVFNKEYQAHGDKLILDNYELKDGLYIKINNDNTIETFVKSSKKIKVDNKTKTEHYFYTLEGTLADNELLWFKTRDYYSNIIETAKAYDAPKKTIHNNNYLTLFMKIEEFLKVEFEYLQSKLYKKVLSFKDFDSKNDKDILEQFCETIKPMSRKKKIIQTMKQMEQALPQIKEQFQEHNPKEYIRIYFEADEKIYKDESAIYLALKIYNKNDYSITTDDIVYGLSNDNMGLNSKKPYLEHKTKSEINKKIIAPFLIQSKTAMQLKLFFDWLTLQPYQTDLLDNMFLNKHSDNGKAVINDYDYLPVKIEKLQSPIDITNLLTIDNKESYQLNHLYELENNIDEIFYNRQLKHNYFRDDLKVSDFVSKKLQQLIFETKYAMVNYFKKYDEKEFYQVVKKYGSDFVIEHLRQGREYKAKESLNLKLSLLQHKGEDIMDIKRMQERMFKKLESSNYENLSKEEFFYLCGQVAKYLISQSEAHEKNSDLLEPFLRAGNAQKLKKDIEFTYFKYKHKISINYGKFNNAMSLIMAYEDEEKLSNNMDSFLIGTLSENIFYMKSNEEEK